MSSGLLIGGLVVPVEGVAIANPLSDPWCRLDVGDYRARRSTWIRQIIIHGTRGGWPQHVLPGAGPGGRDRVVAEFWRGDPEHSAAQIVVDTDGSAACLADVVRAAAYHATVSNDWSIGIEMAQTGDNNVYEATLSSTVRIARALCDHLDIPFQMPGHAYVGAPLARMVDGGKDCVGVFGHRDNTTRRGRGDPGEAIGTELRFAGCEPLNFDAREDLMVWMRRQAKLVRMGELLALDGIAGPATIRALRRHGFKSGRELDAAVEAQ